MASQQREQQVERKRGRGEEGIRPPKRARSVPEEMETVEPAKRPEEVPLPMEAEVPEVAVVPPPQAGTMSKKREREVKAHMERVMAANRKKSPELYFQMETLLDKQEVIFQKLESIIKPNI